MPERLVDLLDQSEPTTVRLVQNLISLKAERLGKEQVLVVLEWFLSEALISERARRVRSQNPAAQTEDGQIRENDVDFLKACSL